MLVKSSIYIYWIFVWVVYMKDGGGAAYMPWRRLTIDDCSGWDTRRKRQRVYPSIHFVYNFPSIYLIHIRNFELINLPSLL